MSNAPSESAQAHFKVTGKVQNVWYRRFAEKHAKTLELKGTITNMPDGSVEAQLQGTRAALDQFKAWCMEGSPNAHPETVEMTPEEPAREFTSIEIG